MSWLEFVARLVDSVAWPVVVLVAMVVLRSPIARLLTDRPPKRLKAGPLEVEWTREIAEAETELSATGTQLPAGTPAESSIVAELTAEAHKAPAIAVLEAHAIVERELRTLLEMKGQPGDERSKAGALGLARLAAERGIIPEETVRAVQGVSVLRNLAAHGSPREITSEQALDYLALVDAVLYTVRG